jgi:hypothetical protein
MEAAKSGFDRDDHLGDSIANVAANIMGRRRVSTFSDSNLKADVISDSNESSGLNNTLIGDGNYHI